MNSEFSQEWEKVQRTHMEMCGWGERCHQSQHESAELIDESFSLARRNFRVSFIAFIHHHEKLYVRKIFVWFYNGHHHSFGWIVGWGDSESFSSWIVNTFHIHPLGLSRPFMRQTDSERIKNNENGITTGPMKREKSVEKISKFSHITLLAYSSPSFAAASASSAWELSHSQSKTRENITHS